MAEMYFKTDGLSVGYNGKALIHDIDLAIEKGEIVTLIGPNGSGKSTILKSITRQLRLIGGKVWIETEELERISLRALAKRMAVVLTERMKPELMTCRDVVSTGRYPYTGRLGLLSDEDEALVTAAMERVHALELSNRDFNAISDGQRQRVLLARAICQDPEIIILDEPTSYLDIRHKLELLSILRSMAKEKGITVIMSLHEIDLAQKISDKIICVKGEIIARFGAPAEVLSEEVVRDLYELTEGAYNADFGSIELPRPAGEPKVMVVSAAGSGIAVFRQLQKEGIAFSCGILYTNDVDYGVARHLAARVIEEKPFCELSEAALTAALAEVDRCSLVVDAGVVMGQTNRRIREVLDRAAQQGKLCTAADYKERIEAL